MSSVIKINFAPMRRVAISLLLIQPFAIGGTAFAQSIVPANDLGTQVNTATNNSQQLNITGGTQAGANLYHSFQQFGLNQGQIANFLSNPSIQNILSRVVGGSPSIINGLIQVTGGNSNLYLLNPAGIIFGSNASLNVPAAFTATTANGIQVGNGWFGVNTSVDAIQNLSGNPQAFGFAANTSSSITPQGAPVINAGNLSVNQGQSITLVGGLVINTGTIAAPSGKVTIAAVPDGKYVKITPEGSLLSLELPVAAQQELAQRSILGSDLPNLLTGSSELRNVTGLNIDNSGNVLVANNPIPSTAGTAIASGTIDVSSNTTQGGEINVLGDRVGLVSANLNASGAIGGGTILIGGDLQGKGIIPNAQYTFVSQDSTILADAISQGNGGKVIVWGDHATRFYGTIMAKGGINSGDGGFVEVSGKTGLEFQGNVNTQAKTGKTGTLLLDPYDLVIGAANISLAQAATLGFGADFTTSTLDFNLINGVAAGTTVTLQARNNITFNSSITNFNNNVNLIASASNNITVASGVNIALFGLNSSISFTAGSINLIGTIVQNSTATNVNLVATGDISIASQGNNFFSTAIEGGNVSISSTNGNISTGSIKAFSNTGTNVSLNANNGSVTLNGFIQSGNSNNATGDSTITIRGNSFRAINPIAGPQNLGLQSIPLSLVTFNAGQQDNIPATPTPRRIELTLPNDPQPRIVAGVASDPLNISITILKDTSFRFAKINPNGAVDPLPSTGSGVEGAISIGATSIPPNVLVLLSDQSFSSNTNLTASALTANSLSGDAIASARTADVQANAGEVKECEPTGTKKPILTLTASLPTRSAQPSKRSNLPPCKE